MSSQNQNSEPPPPQGRTWIDSLSSRHRLFFFIVIVASAALGFVGLGHKQLWIDEIIQAIHSRPNSIGAILNGVAQDRGSAPLDYIVQHFVIAALGTPSEFSARFHAALFGSLSVILIYVISIQLFRNKNTALISAMLYGLYPLHHHYSQEGRPYSLFVLLVLILFSLYLRLRQHACWMGFVLMTLCSILSFYAHPFTAFFFASIFVLDLLRLTSGRVPKFHWGILVPPISCLIAAAAFVPWLKYSFTATHGNFPHPLSFRLLPELIQGLGDGSYPVALLLLFMAGTGIIYLRKNRDDSLMDLLCWILVPIPLLLFLLDRRTYFFAIRQLIFLTPAIMLLAACGTEYLLGKFGKKAIAVPALYALISIFVIAIHYPDKRTDFRAAGKYLRSAVKPGDGIIAPDSLGLLSYYFPDIYGYECAVPDMEKSGRQRIFLVETQHSATSDPSQVLRSCRNMAYQNELFLRGIRISVLRSQQPK